jgi:hypothetical protein
MSTNDNTAPNAARYRLWSRGRDNNRKWFYTGEKTPSRWSLDPSNAKALSADEARRLGGRLIEATDRDFEIEPYHPAYLKAGGEIESLLAEFVALLEEGAIVIVVEV